MDTRFPLELAARFEAEVAAGQLAPGSRWTCEALAARWGVTREALQPVLDAAYRKGLARPCADGYEILGLMRPQLESLFQHASKTGHNPTSDVRAIAVEPAPAVVARWLGVPEGSPVYRMERTRIVDGEVIANQVNFIPYEVCPGLEQEDLTTHSFQRLMEDKYLAVMTEMTETYSLTPAQAEDARILGLAPGAEVLVVERLTLSRTRCPLVWACLHIRPDRYEYVAGLWPEAAKLLEGRRPLQQPA